LSGLLSLHRVLLGPLAIFHHHLLPLHRLLLRFLHRLVLTLHCLLLALHGFLLGTLLRFHHLLLVLHRFLLHGLLSRATLGLNRLPLRFHISRAHTRSR
jgi:hypothetical protein